MVRPYSILLVVFLALGAIAAMLPQKTNRAVELNAQELLRETMLETYVVDVDQLADLLIQKDPSVQLVDLRSPKEYEAFSLPGAVNIPMDSLLSENWAGYLDQQVKKIIFFSNGTTRSSQAWMITRQLGYANNNILKGGLNEWFEKIIRPQEPGATASVEAFDRYQRRVAAGQYFTGKSGSMDQEDSKKDFKPIIRKKKKMVQGGCS